MKMYREKFTIAFTAFGVTSILLIFVITGFFVVDAHAAVIEPQEQAETVQSTGQEEETEITEPPAEPPQDAQIEIPEDQMQLLAELARDLETRRTEIEETGITEFITVDDDTNQAYLIVAVFSVLGGLAALAFVNKWNVGMEQYIILGFFIGFGVVLVSGFMSWAISAVCRLFVKIAKGG